MEALKNTPMSLIKTYGIELDEPEFRIVPLGDVHYGHCNCDIERFLKYVQRIKYEPNTYAVLMGDLIENANPVAPGLSSMEQDRPIMRQLKDMQKALRPIRDKIIGCISGNHEMRASRAAHIDITDLGIATPLEIPYAFGEECFFEVSTPNRDWTILAIHGSGSSVNPEYQVRKAYQVYTGFDVLLMGHVHTVTSGEVYLIGPHLKPKLTVWCRTGSFLKYPPYARRRLYPVSVIGAPILHFHDEVTIERRWRF